MNIREGTRVNQSVSLHAKRIVFLLLCLLLVLGAPAPCSAFAQETGRKHVRRFEEAARESSASAVNRWDEVHVAVGIAEYDPENDGAVIDTVRRADKIMYANKRARKDASG